MNKNSIKQVENKIEEYFFTENKIKLLESTIEDLENQVVKIEDNIKSLEFIEISKIDIKSPNFENIPGNNTPSSYIENGIIKQIEQKESLIKNINIQIEDYKNQIEIIKTKNSQMKNIFNILNDEYKQMLIFRYSKNKSEIEISNKLNISIQHYHRERKRILKDIHNLMVMYQKI